MGFQDLGGSGLGNGSSALRAPQNPHSSLTGSGLTRKTKKKKKRN